MGSTVMRFNLHVAGVIPAEFGMSERSRATFQFNSRAECEPLIFLHCDDLALCSCDIAPRSMRLTLAQQHFAGAVSPKFDTSESSQSTGSLHADRQLSCVSALPRRDQRSDSTTLVPGPAAIRAQSAH